MLLVSDGSRLLAGPSEAGDEPYLIAQRCEGAVVAVGRDRYETGRWLLDRVSVDCVVLDDGFQHVALKRDLDFLLVDASDRQGLEALLPAGRLREPLWAAARASAVLITRADTPIDTTAVCERLRPYLKGHPAIQVLFHVEKLIELGTGTVHEPSLLAGRTGLAVSGVANGQSFRSLLERHGVKVIGDIEFRDHHHYSSKDLARIQDIALRCGAERILTTEKDAVKLKPLLASERQDREITAVRLGCNIIQGREALEGLIRDLIRDT
jgi:tetraacyldisaccharide 4'-kinase